MFGNSVQYRIYQRTYITRKKYKQIVYTNKVEERKGIHGIIMEVNCKYRKKNRFFPLHSLLFV